MMLRDVFLALVLFSSSSCDVSAIETIIGANSSSSGDGNNSTTVPSNGAANETECSVLALIPFTDEQYFSARGDNRLSFDDEAKRWTPETIAATGYSFTAGAALAVYHFNARDPSVVPELQSDLYGECPVQLSVDVIDSHRNNIKSGAAIIHNGEGRCAVLGPHSYDAAASTPSVTSALDVPQVFYSYVSSLVTEPDKFANTVRVQLSPTEYAGKVLHWLQQNGRDHLALFFGGGEYEISLANSLVNSGRDKFNITVQHFQLGFRERPEDVYQQIRKSGIRTIMRSFMDGGPQELIITAQHANRNGLLEDDYLWIFEESLAPVDDIGVVLGKANETSDLYKLLVGGIVFSPLDSWEINHNQQDPFVTSWKGASATLVNQINGMVPFGNMSGDYFQTHLPRRGTSYVYDAVMAIGFGACRAAMNLTDEAMKSQLNFTGAESLGRPSLEDGSAGGYVQNSSAPLPSSHQADQTPPPASRNGEISHLRDNGPEASVDLRTPSAPLIFPGPPITNNNVIGIITSVFTGATGNVAFGEHGLKFKERVSSDVRYGAFNIRSSGGANNKTFEAALVGRSQKDESWADFPGEAMVYRDGTTSMPQPPLVIGEQNYLPRWARIVGLSLMTITWTVVFILVFAICWWRDKALIRAGQPEFLLVTCAGAVLTSSSILALSFDESVGWSDAQLDVACTAAPWLFFLGIVSIYSGVFCKLWRVKQLTTHFRRRQVKAVHVMWPLVRYRCHQMKQSRFLSSLTFHSLCNKHLSGTLAIVHNNFLDCMDRD
jgi:7 transmembrane sweet-taste receptor of 3 GCPR/Receptor family ligand binding region